jgi:hypothetical protein
MEIGQSSNSNSTLTHHVMQHLIIPATSSEQYRKTTMEQEQPHQENQNNDPTKQQPNADDQQSTPTRPGFFVYPETVINNGLNACQKSVLGKIITEKSIHINSIQRGLESIWGSPAGLKIHEIEKGILQFFMDRKYNQERILLGNPWVFRNSWLILKPWDRQMDPKCIDFNHAPVWVQMLGLPAHCKTKEMGESLGSMMGTVETAELYEYPGKKMIVKVKVAINVYQPIQTGILIGNHRDGTHWIDYRYENLPQVCFNCGILGHEEKMCSNEALSIEGHARLGPWIRSNQYGRRMRAEQDRQFHSNPSQGKNYGHYSPTIPASMLAQMAAMNLQEEEQENKKNSTRSEGTSNNRQGTKDTQVQKSITSKTTAMLIQEDIQGVLTLTNRGEGQNESKRPRMELETNSSKDTTMTGPAMQASQGQ